MKRVLIAISLLSMANAAYADKDDFGKVLDDQLAKCTQSANNTLASIDCYTKANKSWDAELNKQYKLLLARQVEEVKGNLKKSQVAWIKYRDSYINAMATFYRQQEGTMWGIVMSEAKLRVTRDKAIELYTLRNSTNMEG